MNGRLSEEIAALAKLSGPALRARYAELFGGTGGGKAGAVGVEGDGRSHLPAGRGVSQAWPWLFAARKFVDNAGRAAPITGSIR